MKQFYTLILILLPTLIFAQIPSGYYDYATGTGYELKTQLKKIIDNVDDPEISNTIEEQHDDQGYNAMDGFIATYERDNYYDTNGNSTILDIYSEIPNNGDNTPNDPYNFTPITDECGNYNSEGDCYNKEHVIPKSVFNDATPMYSDAHELLPTDGRVNGFRSNYPFGVVDDSQLVSQSGISNPTQNGSKLGNNLNSGYSAGYTGVVFEPIDEFKGDIARIYFYFATRYQDQVSNWSFDMFDGSSDKVFNDTFLSILLTWHQMDPVSQKEIDRNNNIFYNHNQNNRNPFIDHPEWVALVWDTDPDTENPTNPTNLVASNPTGNSIDLDWNAATDNIGVVSYDIYVDDVNTYNSTSTSFTVSGLVAETTYCFKVIAKDAAGNESGFSNEDCETTTDNGNTGSTCISESFENIPANSSSYSNTSWTGDDGLEWNATDARTDQTLNGRAITIRDGALTAPTVSGGIGTLTVTTLRVFSGDAGTFDLNVNGNFIATIPYGDTAQTVIIPDINIEGTITVLINNNTSGSNRVMFDDLSWTCYSNLSTDEFNGDAISLYPNPVKGQSISVSSKVTLQFEIYNILGKQVLSGKTINGIISVQNLKAGVYIIKLSNGNQQITKKLIKK